MSAPDRPFSNLAREDVHKSCKSMETVVNLLNSYCEAASAVVVLQKKLAKAIRDAASMKASPTVANNTLNTTATIFEIISEVDGKFVKIADKECDNVNDDVKKWFRKLAREERMHDERMASASARIKQAGLTYERKAKKNARDAAEEHTRYIQLLSSLGPEMSQEKFNHSNFVAQKHAIVSCGVSSSLARIADAEWARCCENVRKSSPQIGGLGEWRSLCDGGWTGKVPDDLPDTDIPVVTGPSFAALPAVKEELNNDIDLAINRAGLVIASRGYAHPVPLPVPPPTTTNSELSQRDPVTTKSDIPALDHFPVPPVHFPPPHLQRGLTNSLDGPVGNPPSYGRQTAFPVSPIQESPDLTATIPPELAVATTTQAPSPATKMKTDISTYLSAPSRSDQYRTLASTDPSTTVLVTDDTDSGILQPHPLPPSGSLDSPNPPKGSPRSSDVVLAMRNRFAQNSVSSVPSREITISIPRLPASVPTITSRYQSDGEQSPQRSGRSQTRTIPEPFPNYAAGADASGTNTDFERTRKEQLRKERDLEQRSKELELEPHQLIRSASAQAENYFIRDRSGGHNRPADTGETVDLQQKVPRSNIPPIGVDPLQQGSTRNPSPMSSYTPTYIGSTGSPQENPGPAKSKGWIRRLSMPVLSSLDGLKKTDSPLHDDSSQVWRSSLALPETKSRHRKGSLDTLGSKSNQRR